jgi:hypothetical protein
MKEIYKSEPTQGKPHTSSCYEYRYLKCTLIGHENQVFYIREKWDNGIKTSQSYSRNLDGVWESGKKEFLRILKQN